MPCGVRRGDQLGGSAPWEFECGGRAARSSAESGMDIVEVMAGVFGNKPGDGMVAYQRAAVQYFNCR